MERLIKVDPENHMYRWYSVGIQNTLVDSLAVVVGWGSLKSSFQRWRTIQMDSLEEAKNLAAKIVSNKIENGYQREKCNSRKQAEHLIIEASENVS